MVNVKKKGFVFVLICMLVICTSAYAMQKTEEVNRTYRNIKIDLDGNNIIPKDANGNIVEPFIIDGTTYLPVRAISTALSLNVEWNGDTNTIELTEIDNPVSIQDNISYDGKKYTETIQRTYRDIVIRFNGKELIPRDANGSIVEPFIIDGTTYLPVRAISEALNLQVSWNDETNTVVLTRKKQESSNPNPNANINDLSAKDIADKYSDAVFYIEIYAFNGELAGSGSGFFISTDGWAITNYHVAANSSYLKIITTNGESYSNVRIADSDYQNDLALLKVEGNGFKCVDIGDSSNIRQGEEVYAIGSPLGLSNTISQGIISNTNRELSGTNYIQISVPIAPGSSGGALFNKKGEVIGVTSAGFINAGADLNLAIPINKISNLEKSNDTDYFLWMDDYYPGYESALDFGSFSGVNLIYSKSNNIIDEYYYDLYDFYAYEDTSAFDMFVNTIHYYLEALECYGYELIENVGDYDEEGLYSNPNNNENIILVIDFEEENIVIWIVKTATVYENDPTVPDLGTFMGLQPIIDSESYSDYIYRWTNNYTYEGMLYKLSDYMDLLTEYFDYECTYAEGTYFRFQRIRK